MNIPSLRALSAKKRTDPSFGGKGRSNQQCHSRGSGNPDRGSLSEPIGSKSRRPIKTHAALPQCCSAAFGGDTSCQIASASPVTLPRNDGSIFFDYLQLIKPRLVLMVLLSAATGYYIASINFADSFKFWMTLLATGLVACGSMTLNEVLEINTDSKMIRTQNRPLPADRLLVREALIFGIITSTIGFTVFVFVINWLSFVLAFMTWAGYLFIYTPLKSKTSLSTIVGAVPGALPPLIGWASATGYVNFHGFILFLIVFFWQLPHFLAIAWMYREDYERAGLPILSVIDREGKFVARQMILNMCALMPVSLLPTIFMLTGTLYFFGAFLLGIFFAAVIIFASSNLDLRARYVLRASVIYLGLLLILMVVDKL